MKLYNIVFSYLEPCQAVCTIGGNSEEEAINKLRSEAEQQVSGIEIISVVEIGELSGTEPTVEETPQATKPPTAEAIHQFEPLPDNVIMFPGNNTKH